MSLDYRIRPMNAADLSFAAACTSGEGWASEDITFLEGFHQYDPQGCFIAERGGAPLGICVATCYAQYGFIGELIVVPEARRQGLGAALLNHGMAYLQRRGADTIYLDGVLDAVPLYERNGFRKLCRSLRFTVTLGEKLQSQLSDAPRNVPEIAECTPKIRGHVRLMQANDLEQVLALDRQAFGVDRGFFIRRCLALYPHLCLVLVDDNQVLGFILSRQGEGWLFAGPWVVQAEAPRPERLLESLWQPAGGKPLRLGVLESNPFAVAYLRSKGFAPAEDSPWRMSWGPDGGLDASTQCYAIGSPAKG